MNFVHIVLLVFLKCFFYVCISTYLHQYAILVTMQLLGFSLLGICSDQEHHYATIQVYVLTLLFTLL